MNILRKAAATVGQWVIDTLNLQDRSSYWFARGTYTGRVVTPETSMQSAAVMACVRLLAEAEASLPIDMFQKQPKGRLEVIGHPVQQLLEHEPNPEMDAMNFRLALMASTALWGNGYAKKVRSSDGRLIALWPLLPDRMKLKRVNGKLFYGYSPQPGGALQEWSADEVFHLRTLGLDGLIGLSPIALHREGIGVALAAEEFAGRFFGNNATPATTLVFPNRLTPETRNQILESWKRAHQGLENAFRVGILEEGMDVKTLSMPLKDAEFLETRKYQRSEIASIFRIPPHMIGDVDRSTSWGSGIEQMSIGFVQYTLLPWLTMWEKAVRRALLTDEEKLKGYYVKHSVNALLRGDTKARFDAYATAINSSVLSPNEARALEDMNPYEGGDEHHMPLNTTTVGTPRPEPLQ